MQLLSEQAVEDAVEESCGEISLHPGQMAFYLSTADITLGIAGIRGGKTHAGAFKTLLHALLHPCGVDDMHLVASPTYPMSKVPTEKLFKLIYDITIFPICPLIKYIKSERMFILACSGGLISRIKVVSLHDPDKIRGIKALSAWLDEAAYISKDAWQIVLGRLADSNGPCWITTTPSGYNWLYEVYEEALEEKRQGIPLTERKIRVFHWRSTDNTFVKEEGFVRLVRSFDARTFAQEVEAKFIQLRGRVYHPFARALHVKSARIDASKPVFLGQDFNVDPMASSIIQPYKTGDGVEGLHIVGERRAADTDTYALVRFLDRFITEHHIPKGNVTVYPDASGRARTTTGKSDFQILRDSKYRVDAPSKNPMVRDRINCVNGLLRPMFYKHPRMLVVPEAVHHIEGFLKQIYEPQSDPPAPDKTQGFDHMMDAIGYPCWKRHPIRMKGSLGMKKAA